MSTLHLVITDNGVLLLQGTGDPSQNAHFSLYDLDGEGGDPFNYAGESWEIVKSIEGVDYDPEDHDSFCQAREEIIKAISDEYQNKPGNSIAEKIREAQNRD